MKSNCLPLRIRGARQHNLRNLDLDLPHDALVAVTGVSGSGKSSLAFDTVFAEGQWRYLESLPSYARMLLEKGARPEVDAIENIRPAIALEQRNAVASARSTVGTLTEVYDLLRLLFSTTGRYHCMSCGREVRTWTPAAAATEAADLLSSGPLTVEFPIADLCGEPETGWAEALQRRGYARVRIHGAVRRLDEEGAIPRQRPEEGTVVLERVAAGSREPLERALDEAFRSGAREVRIAGERRTLTFPTGRVCGDCGREAPELRPVLFSPNHPLGACPTCTGFGAVLVWDEAKVVPDPALTLEEGAVEPWRTPANRWWREELERLADTEGIPLDVPWRELPPRVREKVWKGTPRLDGVEGFFRYLETKRYKMHVRVFLSRYRSPRTCPDCGGDRLTAEVLAVKVGGRSIAEASRDPLDRLAAWIQGLGPEAGERASEILWRIEARLSTILRMGLHYLTLDRPSRTLSGGEMQRVNLARQLSNRLTRTLYVLDEPSIGLHARDVETLSSILRELSESGNTVLFVEHDLAMIRNADHVIELGPGGGRRGGRVVFEGEPAGLAEAETSTGRRLAGHERPPDRRAPRAPRGWLTLRNCRLHNLKDIEARFPLGVLTCVTGVSGSGKSTLVEKTLVPAVSSGGVYGPCDGLEILGGASVSEVRLVDQEPMGRTPRSIPLTYVGVYGAVRELFAVLPTARRLGLTAGHFSFNVGGGRCDRCDGTGYEKLEMLFFEDLFVPCPVCHGRRFKPEVLAVRRNGLSIHDVLGLTVEEALEGFRGERKIEKPLRLLADLGLGYLVLGQPANTLSGGEAQRLKIAAELLGRKPKGVLYVLDEPTTGLHAEDVDRLRAILERLVEAGNSVIVVEHHLDFIASADWIIDLGPEGGEDGGELVDAGPPADVASRGLGPTGRWLATHLAGEGIAQ